MGAVSDFLKEVDEKIDAMWLKPPAEIENLRNPNLREPNTNSFMAINSCYHMLRNLGGFCWTLRMNAKKGKVPVEHLKTLAIGTLEDYSVHTGFAGLPVSAELMTNGAKALAEVKRAEEFVEIMDRLCVYCNKYSSNGWLDILMKWHQLSCAYEAFFKQ